MGKNRALIDYWPKISFDEIADVEIKDGLNLFYQIILFLLCFPQKTIDAFSSLFKTLKIGPIA